jgi:hypothetical protein
MGQEGSFMLVSGLAPANAPMPFRTASLPPFQVYL